MLRDGSWSTNHTHTHTHTCYALQGGTAVETHTALVLAILYTHSFTTALLHLLYDSFTHTQLYDSFTATALRQLYTHTQLYDSFTTPALRLALLHLLRIARGNGCRNSSSHSRSRAPLSACSVSMRQHTPAYVSMRQYTH